MLRAEEAAHSDCKAVAKVIHIKVACNGAGNSYRHRYPLASLTNFCISSG